MDGLRDSSTLKGRSNEYCATVMKEHCVCVCGTKCRFHCCRWIFKNVTIVGVFGRENTKNVYFHFKVHFGILLLVSFDPRGNEDRLFSCYFFFPPVSFLLFFRGGISHEISMHGCANSSIVRLDLRINRYLR